MNISSTPAFWRWNDLDLILDIHVQPGSRHEGIAGLHGARLKIKVAAPASDGRANHRLLEWLAAQMDLPVSRLDLLQGAGSRTKRVRIREAPVALEQHLLRWSQIR